MDDKDPDTFDARDAARVLQDQTDRAASGLAYPERLMYVVWGTAYLLGYLPMALSVGPDAVLDLPLWLALGALFVAIATGIALSIWISARASRGIRGSSATRGVLYGLSWWIAFLSVLGMSARVEALGVSQADGGVVINGTSMVIVATLFMAGGAIWLDLTQFVVGVVISLVTTVALFAGLPAYYWIMTFGVGGMLLVAAALHRPLQGPLQRRFHRAGGAPDGTSWPS